MKPVRPAFHAFLASLLVGLALAAPAGAAAPEPIADSLLDDLLATVQALREKHPDARLLTFWDFDGTVLKGDCSEGYEKDGRAVYPGLAQRAIEQGLSTQYRPKGGFAEFWRDYRTLDDRVGHWLAYPYLLQMLAGARAEDVAQLARDHFRTVLAPYVFATSKHLLDNLAAHGVENHLLSASAELFVRGAGEELGIPPDHIHGIRVRIRDGALTHELVYPVTFAEGKRERLQEIVDQIRRESPGREVFVIAAFGNSYTTDADFLAFTARQHLPAGHPLAVMFNGGPEPERWRGLFRRAEIDAVLGPP